MEEKLNLFIRLTSFLSKRKKENKRKSSVRVTWRADDAHKIGLTNNTILYLEKRNRPDGVVENMCAIIKYHKTDVIVAYPDGLIILDSGGWRTKTTKERMNNFLFYYDKEAKSYVMMASVFSDKGIWYITVKKEKENENLFDYDAAFIFRDKTIFYPDDDGVRYLFDNNLFDGKDERFPTKKEITKQQKDIKKYVKGYMEAFWKGEVKAPDAGDCMICRMFKKADDHVLSHIEEKYYVPSLLARAIGTFPNVISNAARWAVTRRWYPKKDISCELNDCFRGVANRQLSRALRRYLYKCVGLAF